MQIMETSQHKVMKLPPYDGEHNFETTFSYVFNCWKSGSILSSMSATGHPCPKLHLDRQHIMGD